MADVDHVAINQDGRANFIAKLKYLVSQLPGPGLVLARLKNRQARTGIPELLQREFPDDRFRGAMQKVEHHLAHLSSAFHVSPFEQAAVVSIDGFGDFSSAAWGTGKGSAIAIENRIYFPHSLGIFYQALTQYLGFPDYGDEYKVMGLAPYGSPAAMDAMRSIVHLKSDGGFELDLAYFIHHKEPISYEWNDGSPVFADLFSSALEELLGPRRKPADPIEDRHRNIARSAQLMYEEAFFHLLSTIQRRSGLKNWRLPEAAQ